MSCAAQQQAGTCTCSLSIPVSFFAHVLVMMCCLSLELFSFEKHCVSLQEVAQRRQSRALAPVRNDRENAKSSSEEKQGCPCHVRVSKISMMLAEVCDKAEY